MAELHPFQAVRYDPARFGGDLSPVLAPPYDVLDHTDKEALLARSGRNFVAIDLPHVAPKSAGPAEVYQRAAKRLGQWLDDGTLVRDRSPAIYLYHQCFRHEGAPFTRRMFIARVRLEPLGEASILPHERTFGGPKADRLALMKATRCQLSPIFGLYNDPDNEIVAAFDDAAASAPDASGMLRAVENRLWAITDRRITDSVVSLMSDRKIYIADGHHRYGTALLYRDWLAEQHGGRLPTDHPAHFVMFVLAGMDDPGCLILPYHRVLGGVGAEALLGRWTEGVQRADGSPPDMVLFDGATGRETFVRFTRRGALRELEPGQVAPWYDLDYAYLHRYLLDELLAQGAQARTHEGNSVPREPESGRSAPRVESSSTTEPRPSHAAPRRDREAAERPRTSRERERADSAGRDSSASAGVIVYYVKSGEDARRLASRTGGVALLMNATPMAHLRAVAQAGGLMPPKSTCFHPKIPTGITLYPLS